MRLTDGWKKGVAVSFLALLTAAAPDPHPRALVGRYDGGQTEIAAGLELRADGRFDYTLSYGALDEEAAGTWEAEGDRVLLTSAPKAAPPAFDVVSDAPVISGELFVMLEDVRVLHGAAFQLVLLYESGDDELAEVAEDGKVLLPDSRRPDAFVPTIPVYGPVGEPIPFAGKSGRRIVLRFAANDIGKAAFEATPLAIEDKALVLARHDRILRFVKR